MLGAIIGDIVGSIYEFDNLKSKEFIFLTEDNYITDDSVLTIGTAKAILEAEGNKDKLSELFAKHYRDEARTYPFSGYGPHFFKWMLGEIDKPYYSLGNGSAMRVSPCGWAANSLEEAAELARLSASVTHNHPEGIRGAEVVAKCIYLARTGHSKEEILEEIKKDYSEDFLNLFTLDKIRPTYKFEVTCPGSVPQALEAFLEGTSFEDVIRNAISIGGDSDTIAAIAGSIAEAYYGIPEDIEKQAYTYLDEEQIKVINTFRSKYI